MGLFKSKEEKKAKKEANAFFLGQTLQAIGRIPAGKNVGISLEPERQVLKIQYEETAITLPYSRIISFMLEDETKLSDKRNAGLRALAGGALFGVTGAIVGAASAKNKATKKWVGILTYKDKEGQIQSLAFLQMALTKPYDGETKHYGASQFEKMVNEIASRNSENITEL